MASLIREEKEVCTVCFNASSHKPKPKLIIVESTKEEKGSGEKFCEGCAQKWKKLHVVRGTNNKWFPVRPRPARVTGEYQVCTYREKCQKGAVCTFAHSSEELEVWKRDRMAEQMKSGGDVRPFPDFQAAGVNASSEIILQLCKNFLLGSCTYAKRCTFAHSEPELRTWGAEMQKRKKGEKALQSTTTSCPVCQVPCNSFQMLRDHLSGQKHASRVEVEQDRLRQQQRMAQHQLQLQPVVQARPMAASQASSSSAFRPPPSMPWIREYRMCWYADSDRRCPHGTSCTYAHSPGEQAHWSSQLRRRSEVAESSRAEIPSLASKAGVSPRPPSTHFVQQTRQEVTRDNQAARKLTQPQDGIDIRETSDCGLDLQVTSGETISWVFRITFTRPMLFQAVVLLDPTLTDFSLHSAVNLKNKTVFPSVTDNDGIFINQQINPGDVFDVNVQCAPGGGKREQFVLFKCENILVGRLLSVSHISSQMTQLIQDAERTNQAQSSLTQKINSRSLFWEETLTILEYEPGSQPLHLHNVQQYPLYPDIEKKLLEGHYDNQLKHGLTADDYKHQLHTLLYIEEYQRRHDIKRYDMYATMLDLQDRFELDSGAMIFPRQGHKLCRIPLNEPLDDRDHSLSESSVALVRPQGSRNTVFEAPVDHLGRDYVILELSKPAVEACALGKQVVDIRFRHYRHLLRTIHHAVDELELSVVFPLTSLSTPPGLLLGQANYIDFAEDLKVSQLNAKQKAVVETVLQDEHRQIPTLLCGPFGTGKTRTLVEAVFQLMKHAPTAKVLVCSHVNQTADMYVKELHERWSALGQKRMSLLRLYYMQRRLSTIESAVQKYCSIRDNGIYLPSLERIQEHQVIVTTSENAHVLSSCGMPKNYFTHIILDEACQVMEAEALIAVSLAHVGTKIVLAGDHMQMEPAVHSLLARRFDLHRSLLDRMFDNKIYETFPQLRVELTDNYRCVKEILELPSELFYNKQLVGCFQRSASGPRHIPPMVFYNVRGQESQDSDSPSFHNVHEAATVVGAVEELVNGPSGLPAEDICVVSPYAKQVQFIRSMLRPKRLGRVSVLNMRQMQGREFRAIVISTVRSCAGHPNIVEESPQLGFLSNPKLFNTAITRAKEWLIVVGDAFTLAAVGSNRSCWLTFMRHCHRFGSFKSDDNSSHAFESLLSSGGHERDLVAAIAHQQCPSEERVSLPPSDSKLLDVLANKLLRREVLWPRLEPLVRELQPKRYHEITVALLGLSAEDVLGLLVNKALRLNLVKMAADHLGQGRPAEVVARDIQQFLHQRKAHQMQSRPPLPGHTIPPQQLASHHVLPQQTPPHQLPPQQVPPHQVPPQQQLHHQQLLVQQQQKQQLLQQQQQQAMSSPRTFKAAPGGQVSQLPPQLTAQPGKQLFGLLPGQNPPEAITAQLGAMAMTEPPAGVMAVEELYGRQNKLMEELDRCCHALLKTIHTALPKAPQTAGLMQLHQQQLMGVAQLRNHQKQCFQQFLAVRSLTASPVATTNGANAELNQQPAAHRALPSQHQQVQEQDLTPGAGRPSQRVYQGHVLPSQKVASPSPQMRQPGREVQPQLPNPSHVPNAGDGPEEDVYQSDDEDTWQ